MLLRVLSARARASLLVGLAGLIVACAAPAAPGGQSAGSESPQRAPRNLVLIAQAQPDSVAAKSLRRTGGRRIDGTLRVFNAGLAIHDDRDEHHPYLAEALPQLNTSAWQVHPDGRTETTYVLRPGLTWHDGTPLTTEDFVFAARVFARPDLGVAATPPMSYLEEVVAADARTVTFRWRQPYLHGGSLEATDFQALPHHLLEAPFESETSDAFVSHPFWGGEYVGLGPYRMGRWELGSFIEASAFAGHALGRPRIDRLRVTFLSDPNTAVAVLLSGEAHGTIDDPLRMQQATILKREWEPRGTGVVMLVPAQVRHHNVQMKPEYANPRAMLDRRVRRALVHALDRQEIADGLLDGQGTVAHSLMSPYLQYFPEIEAAVAKYPYDLRRTEELMLEAGFSRGSDGTYTSPTEGRFTPEVRINAAGQNEAEGTVMADSLRRAGMDSSVYVIPQAMASDAQFRATFPTLTGTGNILSPDPPIESFRASQIPTPENRWRGNNRGGWHNADFERLAAAYDTTLDRTENRRLIVQIMRLMTEELPDVPVYYNLAVIAHLADLKGPLPSTSTDGAVWNLHQWEWR
jgi:peptide/nickel transport system substrate-binding protein